MQQGPERRHDPQNRIFPTPAARMVAVHCTVIDDALVKAGLCWLAIQAAQTRLDAMIVVPSLADAKCLACSLPQYTLGELVAGNLVRMGDASLQLLAAHEVMPRARPDNVVLSLGLSSRDTARIDRMNPAASFLVSVDSCDR